MLWRFNNISQTYCIQIVLYELSYVHYVYTTYKLTRTSAVKYTHPNCLTTWVCKFLFEWSYFWMNEICLRVLEHMNPPSSFDVYSQTSSQRLLESNRYCTRRVIRLYRINKLEVVTTKTRLYYFKLQIFRCMIPRHTSFSNILFLFPSPPILPNHSV